MAEFCLECWNKLNGTRDKPRKYVLSKDLELCEECGELKHIIIKRRKRGAGLLPIFLTVTAILVAAAGTLLSIVFGAPGGQASFWRTLLYFMITVAAAALLLGVGEIINLLRAVQDERE